MQLIHKCSLRLPHLFSTFMQASVSVKRLNKFLNMEELDRNAVTHGDSYSMEAKTSLFFMQARHFACVLIAIL